MQSGLDIRRAGHRLVTRTDWLDSRHSFSFGYHQDPRNTHHGLLLVNNDDVVQPDTGFRTHPHQDMEIVTRVLEGELEHRDTLGNHGVIYPGLAQRMSAGTGIWHSEMNATHGEPVHFAQMWVLLDTFRVEPGHEQLEVARELDRGGLIPIASGRGHQAAIAIRQRGAPLWGGRPRPGERVTVPDAPFAHLFIARGAAELAGAGALGEGDGPRQTTAGGPRLTAGSAVGAEVLIWEMTPPR